MFYRKSYSAWNYSNLFFEMLTSNSLTKVNKLPKNKVKKWFTDGNIFDKD